MKIVQLLCATLFLGFGITNAMQQETQKIRAGSARVRVTLVNNTEHAYTAQGWYEGTRGEKETREGFKKAVKPKTFQAHEQEGRFHMTFGKKSTPQVETQEVDITSPNRYALSMINIIELVDGGNLKYTGILQAATFTAPQTISFIVPKPADTAAEIEIRVMLAGNNLELSRIEVGQKPMKLEKKAKAVKQPKN